MKRATIISNKNTMVFKLSFLWIIGLVLCGNRAFALDPLGPPASDIQKWQLYTGFEYSLSSMDIKLTNGSWTGEATGQPDTSGVAIDLDIEDIESDKLNVYFGYGIGRNWEAFVRLGAASSEFSHSDLNPPGKFDGDYEPFIGGGLRLTLLEGRDLKIGAVAQASWEKHNGKITPSLYTTPSFVNMDFKEIQVALGALYQWTDYISFYGGPFYHFLSGELKDNFLGIGLDENNNSYLENDEFTWDIESDSGFGGYLGTRVEIDRNFFLNCEYQMTSNSDSFAAGIMWKY